MSKKSLQRGYVHGFVQRDAEGAPPADGPIRFVAATEGVKADGLDLRMDRANLDRYLSNPVVMYGHQYFGRDALPIGRSVHTEIDGTPQLLADLEFDRDDDFAAKVDRKIRGGYLNAVSIGFDFWTADIEPDGRMVPNDWELMEISVVPLPMDPNALAAPGRQRLADTAGLDARLAAIEQRLADLTRTDVTPVPAAAKQSNDVAMATRLRRLQLAEMA